MPKLYTKTGDKGVSSLYDGQRLSKTDARFQALGDLDELNCHLGLAKAYWKEASPLDGTWGKIGDKLTDIQRTIMVLSSWVATPGTPEPEVDTPGMERDIDELSGLTPPIKNFVVPSGNKLCSQVHVCRAVCRRAERKVIDVGLNSIYLNRLSDYLFALSRFVSMKLYEPEDLWTP